MNADQINQVRTKYRNHLSTTEGRKQLAMAVDIKKVWMQQIKNCSVTTNTAGVNTNYIISNLSNKITKITIIPIGLNNMCHMTSELLCDDAVGITRRLGFNISACPCGKRMSYELHSVNKCNEQLYDFTKDFNDETEKYFLELNTNMTAKQYINYFGENPLVVNKGCKCKINWANMDKYLVTEQRLINHIHLVEFTTFV